MKTLYFITIWLLKGDKQTDVIRVSIKLKGSVNGSDKVVATVYLSTIIIE